MCLLCLFWLTPLSPCFPNIARTWLDGRIATRYDKDLHCCSGGGIWCCPFHFRGGHKLPHLLSGFKDNGESRCNEPDSVSAAARNYRAYGAVLHRLGVAGNVDDAVRQQPARRNEEQRAHFV